MSPDFEHFFWGNPGEVESTFMLIDGLENRFLIQSYDHELLYKLTKIMSSKISLNVLDLTHTNISSTESITDNSVIENWGLENPPSALVETAPLLFNGIKKSKTKIQEEFADSFPLIPEVHDPVDGPEESAAQGQQDSCKV